MKKNILVGQSGGPTAVINASLYGVIAEVETIAVIKKNSKKYNTKGCVKVMGELS